MSQQEQWQFDENTDALDERYLVPTMFEPWAADLFELAALQPGDRLLDIACGTGIVARLMAPHVARVVGLDMSADRLAVAGSLAPDIEWREGNATALPFPDGSFDLATCHQGRPGSCASIRPGTAGVAGYFPCRCSEAAHSPIIPPLKGIIATDS